jgi:hypothetical protein
VAGNIAAAQKNNRKQMLAIFNLASIAFTTKF